MRRAAGFVSALAVGALVVAGLAPPVAADHVPPEPGFFESPGQSTSDLDRLDPVRFAYEDAIVEHVQVETRTSDFGAPTQIWVDIIRPDTDEPVPTIMMPSPYYNTLGRGWRGQLKTPHQGPAFPTSPGVPFLGGSEQTPFPEWYDEYFVPRGYAYAAMDLRGTRNSSGCQVYGDRDEVLDAVDVVDWIAEQPWSNGKVGLTGGSYDGTISIGVAAEHPISGEHPGAVGAVIPIRPIDRWYDYHFFNGVQSSGHAATPALFTAALAGADTQNAGSDDVLLPLHVVERKACIATVGAAVDAGYASPYQDADAPFWAERDFRKDAEGMTAAVFWMHGLFDFNVKTNNAGYLWESLPEDLPRKLWYYNGDHADPHLPSAEDAEAGGHVVPFPFRDRFIEWNHRWWLQFLKGVEAGALEGPEVEVQRADGTWVDGGDHPAATEDLALYPAPDGTAPTSPPADAGTLEWADGETSSAPASATVVSAPFDSDTRLSGQIAFDLDLTIEGPDTTVAVDVRAVPPGVEPDADATETMDGSVAAPLRFLYGWARAWYRDTIPLRGVSTPTGGSQVPSGEPFALTFGSLYTDIVIPAGHRLAFTFSNSAGGTVPANMGGTVTLHTGPDASRILLPVAPPTDDVTTSVTRHGGVDRIATAAAISTATRGRRAEVVIATNATYPDALAGAPLAVSRDAPLLLTAPDALSPDTAAELTRLGATSAVVLGGEEAISPQVVADLEALGLTVERIQGANRFGTAAAIRAALPDDGTDEVFVVEGIHADPSRGWPDALSASGLAAALGEPILLVSHDVVPDETAGALAASDAVRIVGGPAAVSEAVAADLDARVGTVSRLEGPDRYGTSTAVTDEALRRGISPGVTWVATGRNWPDGLTAGAAAGAARGVLLLVDGTDLAGSPVSTAWLARERHRIASLLLAGGPVAISLAVEDALRALVTTPS